MAYVYEEMLGIYLHKPTLKYIKGKVDPNHRSYGHFARAVDIAQDCGADFCDYVQAQFYWFDKWFNRAPKPWELAGVKTKFPAPNRYREYLKLRASQHVPTHVKSVARRAKIDPKKLDKINESRLAELQRNWGISEEEAFIRFARPGVGYFDVAWLRKHPTYQRLRREKKL